MIEEYQEKKEYIGLTGIFYATRKVKRPYCKTRVDRGTAKRLFIQIMDRGNIVTKYLHELLTSDSKNQQ